MMCSDCRRSCAFNVASRNATNSPAKNGMPNLPSITSAQGITHQAWGGICGLMIRLPISTPGDPQSWNLYSYVRNNPLNATDPSGHECVNNSNGGCTRMIAISCP
jgi:hypothetical protein